MLAAIDDERMPLGQVLATAQDVVSRTDADPYPGALARVRSVAADRGWTVSDDNPGARQCAEALDRLADIDRDDLGGMLERYADPVLDIARGDLRAVADDRGDRDRMAETLAGMAIAFLMTGPTQAQLADFQGIAGAHAVGVADGGAGLPFLGWSSEGGDLRVPHFVGMHALQLLPLGLLGLELAGRRIRVLGDPRVRLELVAVAALAMVALLALLTLQALAGQPVVPPAGPFLAAGVALVVATLDATTVVLVRGRARSAPTLATVHA